jgi:hypothetical protein
MLFAIKLSSSVIFNYLLFLFFFQEVRLWFSSAECLVDACVVLLRKLAHAQMVPLSTFLLICAMKDWSY